MTNYHMSILTKISNSNHLHTCIAGPAMYVYIYLHCRYIGICRYIIPALQVLHSRKTLILALRYIEGSSETGGSFNG
jgi:hypothetical protein